MAKEVFITLLPEDLTEFLKEAGFEAGEVDCVRYIAHPGDTIVTPDGSRFCLGADVQFVAFSRRVVDDDQAEDYQEGDFSERLLSSG